jgi:hypothetical protein
MTATTTTTGQLSDSQVVELLALTKQSDSVELKLTVPATQQRATIGALGIDPLQATIRQVFFFDTPELALDAHGVVVRARRTQNKPDDSVVKLRPVVPAELPDELRRSGSCKVEVDAMPGGFVCSASVVGALRTTDVADALAGRRPLRKLFSREQRQFYEQQAPAGISLDDLTPLGPIFVLKTKIAPPELDRRLTAEMWLYPDGVRILELSTKSAPADAFRVAAELRAYLSQHGIDRTGEQQTKTRKALEFFASQLTASPPETGA